MILLASPPVKWYNRGVLSRDRQPLPTAGKGVPQPVGAGMKEQMKGQFQ